MLLSHGSLVAGLNYAFSGKITWEKEADHKSDIDVTAIMQAMPWVKDDKQRYYIKPGKQFREVLRYLGNQFEILGAKFSPAVHTVIEQFAGSQAGGGWDMPWVREDMSFYESIPERTLAVAEKFVPFSARGNNFAFAFPMSKGMTPWKALRAYEDTIRAQVDLNLHDRLNLGVRFYDLRYYATLLLGQGVHAKIVSDPLGHSNIGITMDLYSHVTPGMQKEAANKIEDALS